MPGTREQDRHLSIVLGAIGIAFVAGGFLLGSASDLERWHWLLVATVFGALSVWAWNKHQ